MAYNSSPTELLAMNPGELRHQITWLSEQIAPDTSGVGVSWAPDVPPRKSWAKIEPMSAQEAIKAGQDIGQVTARVVVRYQRWISDTMRFLSPNGGIWVIKGVQNLLERNIYLVLTCSNLGPDKP